jgi:hypothetical protein
MRAHNIAFAMTAVLLVASSEADLPTSRESWTISAVPTVSIGLVEGDSAYLFQRIVDARFTPRGRIVVADGGLSLVREYDHDGTFLAQMGGSGSGPGEFQSLRDIWTVQDTVGAWDSRALRLTYFGSDRTVARTVSLESANAAAGGGRLDFLAGALADGSLVLASVAFADGLGPDRVSIERMSASGEHLGRLGETTGLVRARLAEKVNGPIPFSPYPHVATHGDTVYHTNGREPLVTAWSAAGEWTISFPAHDYDAERQWSALVAEVERRSLEPVLRVVSTAPRPDWIPHLSGLLVDDAGRIWARRYEPGTDAIWLGGGARGFGGTWWVADPAGRVIASVQVPAGFAPLEIEDARVLGVSVDSLGVERVEVRTISR